MYDSNRVIPDGGTDITNIGRISYTQIRKPDFGQSLKRWLAWTLATKWIFRQLNPSFEGVEIHALFAFSYIIRKNFTLLYATEVQKFYILWRYLQWMK